MKKRDTLTQKQKQVYDYVRQYISEKGQSPTLGEIAKAIGAQHLRSVTQHLQALQIKNLLRRERYMQRGIRLIENEQSHEELLQLPVFASAGCGSPSVIAERTFDEYIPVSTKFTEGKKENLYVIKAIGGSMNEAGINDGDFVLVERTQDVQANDLVVAIIEENAVIKKITYANNAVILNPVSSDKSYRPIIMRRDFEIFGKVIDVIRVEKNYEYQFIPIDHE